MPRVPFAATSIEGVKACVVGSVFTRFGGDQVSPPSWDLEKAIADPEGARVASCHTRYADRFGPAATSGMMSPVRSGVPSSGSATKPGSAFATVIGLLQVAPWSLEIITATSWPFLFDPEPWKSMKQSSKVPSDSTTIWCPMLNWLARGAKMARGFSQVWPPSVVRENMASLRTDRGKPSIECTSRLSLGNLLRSQIA